MKIEMNETRVKVLEALKNATKPLTLAEISEIIGVEVKSGTTNHMVDAQLMKKVGTKKVPKVIYTNVTTYAIGDNALENN